jgi:gentisate 1,2-dioxygenase
MEMKSGEVVRNAEERKNFYGRIDKENLAPLWEVLKGLVPGAPKASMIAGGCSLQKKPSAACWCWRIPRCAVNR